MKQHFLLLLLLSVVTSRCKKVDNELAKQDAMPSVNTGDISFYVNGATIVASYPTEVIVGDTITLAGRLKIDQGATITLGNSEATFLFKTQQPFKEPKSGTTVMMDIVRFVITPEMGNGPQTLVIRNGSYVRTAPDITIRTIPVISSRTDTTLIVRSILSSVIAGFETRYQNMSGNFFNGFAVADSGEVWLQTGIDIYRISNGQMESFMKEGDVLTINDQSVTITDFLGLTVNKANTTLYLSVNTKDPANTLAGRYYLLKMDIASRQITVLNSTWYERRNSSSGQLVKVTPAQFINSGPAMNIPIKAAGLQIDARDRILFINDIGVFQSGGYTAIKNLSRIDGNGRLTTLLEGQANSDKFKYSKLFDISDDGRYAWLTPSGGGLIYYDLELEELVAKADASQSLFYVSYEENREYRFTTLLKPFNDPSDQASYHAMPNGELLQSYGTSVAAIELNAGALYAYAGLERGVNNTTVYAGQTNTTGQARYVNFAGIKLLGADGQGNVYFMHDGLKSGTMVKPPRLYMMGKP